MKSDRTRGDIDLARFTERVLNDAVLGFFALVSLFLMITPTVFELPQERREILLVVEYAIIALFAVEYLAAWYLAVDKMAFVFNRWRIIDAIIIAAALFAFFPFGPDALRNSPVLRLARLARVAYLGTRSRIGLKAVTESKGLASGTTTGEPKVFALSAAGAELESTTWEEGLKRISAPDPDWIFISGVSEDRLADIATGLAVPL